MCGSALWTVWKRRSAVALALAAGCATPGVVRRVTAAHPAATYEASVRGCEFHPALAGRQFGADFNEALLWARQVAGTARWSQCEITIEALEGERRVPVYRISRDARGRREGVIEPPRPTGSGPTHVQGFPVRHIPIFA